ncbi:MAG: HEAT repeat domain-containing protein, partial [bacterium]
MRLRAVISDGVRVNWKMTSPLTDLERIILSQSKWRVDENALDVHDKVVLAGMPFHPKKIIKTEGALRALGQAVLNPDPLIREAGLAALGDRNNFGNPSCLAQVVPRLTDPDPRVKAAALRGIEQIAKPGDDKQFMEVEI